MVDHDAGAALYQDDGNPPEPTPERDAAVLPDGTLVEAPMAATEVTPPVEWPDAAPAVFEAAPVVTEAPTVSESVPVDAPTNNEESSA